MQAWSTSHSWKRLPTVDELGDLEMEIMMITDDLNEARLRGYLFQALKARGQKQK
jgi:hypothetical protein